MQEKAIRISKKLADEGIGNESKHSPSKLNIGFLPIFHKLLGKPEVLIALLVLVDGIITILALNTGFFQESRKISKTILASSQIDFMLFKVVWISIFLLATAKLPSVIKTTMFSIMLSAYSIIMTLNTITVVGVLYA